ncbi:MAG: hypothetical protein K1000chlam2_00872 [Chlamydiae bacterium]|nr:hypothetical protein [Chlamydiota bacterium]
MNGTGTLRDPNFSVVLFPGLILLRDIDRGHFEERLHRDERDVRFNHPHGVIKSEFPNILGGPSREFIIQLVPYRYFGRERAEKIQDS